MNNFPSWKCLWEASKGLARQIVALNQRLLFSALSFKFNQFCIGSSLFSCKNYCHLQHFHVWNGNPIYYNPIAIVNLTYEEMLGGGGEDLMETTCVREDREVPLLWQNNPTRPTLCPYLHTSYLSRAVKFFTDLTRKIGNLLRKIGNLLRKIGNLLRKIGNLLRFSV